MNQLNILSSLNIEKVKKCNQKRQHLEKILKKNIKQFIQQRLVSTLLRILKLKKDQ